MSTSPIKKASILTVVAAVFASPNASACATWWTTVEHFPASGQVVASGLLTQADPGTGLHAAISLVGPGGSAADDSGDVFGEFSVFVTAFINIGLNDGTYFGTGTYDQVPWPGVRVLLGQESKNKTVNPWVQLVSASQSSTTIAKQGGQAGYTSVARTSNGCVGNVTVNAWRSAPSQMLISIGPSGQGYSGQTSTFSLQLSMSGGSTRNYNFGLATSSANMVTGMVSAGSDIEAHPANCELRINPPPGSSVVRNYTVTP